MQYTVFAMYPSSLGYPVEESDIKRMNDLLDEEVRAAGLEHQARVIVSEDAGRYTMYDAGHTSIEGLDEAVERAWTIFMGGSDSDEDSWNEAEFQRERDHDQEINDLESTMREEDEIATYAATDEGTN